MLIMLSTSVMVAAPILLILLTFLLTQMTITGVLMMPRESTVFSPSHVYGAQQIYNVMLTVGNSVCKDTVTKPVDITRL